MAIKNTTSIIIDGRYRTSSAVMPLKWGNFLDERLDECHLALRGVKKEVFSSLTPVEIRITNEKYWGVEHKTVARTYTETKYFIVANDNVTETQLGSDYYNHDLYLIEVTKIAECVVVDTLTFTNSLGNTYTNSEIYATPQWE